jgi:hypothetical protein
MSGGHPDEEPPVDLGAIVRRLSEIDELLSGPDREPSPQRFALLTERDTLRERAEKLRVGRDRSRATDQLIAERDALNLELRRETSDRTGYMTAMGGGNSSPAGGEWVTLAAAARGAGRFDQIRARISEIEMELSRRETAST